MLSATYLSNSVFIFVDQSFTYRIFVWVKRAVCSTHFIFHVYQIIMWKEKSRFSPLRDFQFPGFFRRKWFWGNVVNSRCNTMNGFRKQVTKFLKNGSYLFNDIICEVQQTINFTVSPCIFYIDLICTNVCTCIYQYNITYAVTLVTLFAPTCFDHTWSSSGSRACPC